MNETQVSAMLTKLNYSRRWLDTGVLTISRLIEQVAVLESGEDDNTEHYRYSTLKDFLDSAILYSNETVSEIIDLLKYDPDQSMASSAMILIMKQKSLTDKQFEMVVNSFKSFGDWTNKYVDNARKTRNLNAQS